ncbi:MAG: hypothetical protein WCU83_12830 [Bacteroidia bacterium]
MGLKTSLSIPHFSVRFCGTIIEGILLLKVLERLELKADKFLYATKKDWFEDWKINEKSKKDSDIIIKDVESLTDFVDKLKNPEKQGPYKLGTFRTEMYRYTHDYKPMENADEILIIHHSN